MKVNISFKKALALLAAATLICGAAGCSGTATATPTPSAAPTATPEPVKEKVSLRLWGSQDDQAMLGQMVTSFKAANPDKEYDIKLAVVGEPDAVTRYLEDPNAAADVFAFSNDQLYTFTDAGGLYEITRNKDAIIAANGAGSIEAASVGDSLYAYPMTADNGYFLYYDKSVISEEQAESLDGILEACADANKKMFFDISNGWYIASFFLGAGGSLTIDEEGKQVCDFNNENGVKAGEAIKALTAHTAFLTGDDAVLTGGFGDTIAAGVSGTWNAEAILEKLGENFAATKLPTFTMDGEQIQLGSFGGYKLVGINSLTASPLDAMALAEWITNEENQLLRFQKRAMGPSNINVADSEEVKANIPLAALSMQGQYATSQKDVLNSFWNPAEAFGTAMETKDYSKSVQQMLDEMVAQITQ